MVSLAQMARSRSDWLFPCDRALAVEGELTAPFLAGTPGIPFAMVEIFAHGETSEFFNLLATEPPCHDQCQSRGGAPRPPACANPGVLRSLEVQPIFLRTDS